MLCALMRHGRCPQLGNRAWGVSTSRLRPGSNILLRQPKLSPGPRFAGTKSAKIANEEFPKHKPRTVKTAWIGISKLTTVLLFGAACVLAAPTFYYDENSSNFLVPAGKSSAQAIPLKASFGIAIFVGAIPLVVISLTSSPFVAFVHLKLPPAARVSKEALLRWAKKAPPETQVTLTTLKLNTNARQIRTRLRELAPRRGFPGDFANISLKREKPSEQPRPWYQLKEQTRFFVDPVYNKSQIPDVWSNVWKTLGASN